MSVRGLPLSLTLPDPSTMISPSDKRILLLTLLAPLFVLASCGQGGDNQQSAETVPTITAVFPWDLTPSVTDTPAVPQVALALTEDDVSLAPLPLRAGFPFTLTATIHNSADIAAVDVPFMVHISAYQEEIGHTSFLRLFTMTVPASATLPVTVPVEWNFAGGEHQLWVQVNRLPEAWLDRAPTLPEANTSDNIILLDLMIDPFDAYTSDLCPGRVDVEIGPTDVLPEPDQQRVSVRVHNLGNHAAYNLPVVVIGEGLAGIAYTPAIPPCGGTADVHVTVDRPLQQGDSLTVQVNPSEWTTALVEDDFGNNSVTVAAGLVPGVVLPPQSKPDDYDFEITSDGIEIPEMWIIQVTVHNLGTRDAAMVPLRIENENGRKLTESVLLVRGEGLGVAAFPVGYLWIPGGTLTFTINPADHKDAYPETNRDNNVATFTLP